MAAEGSARSGARVHEAETSEVDVPSLVLVGLFLGATSRWSSRLSARLHEQGEA